MMADLELSANQQQGHHQDDPQVESPLKPQQQNDKEYPEESQASPSPFSSSSYAATAKLAWEWACWSGTKTWDGLDFAGEVVANFLGLTTSKYQWMIDMQEHEDEDRRQRKLEARQRRQLRLEQLLEQEKRKLQELEAGECDESDADDLESRDTNQIEGGQC